MMKRINMFIKRCILIVLTILTGTALLYAQQPVSGADGLKGEWQIEKTQTQLFSQQGNKLLEEKTYTVVDSMQKIKGLLPLDIRFHEHNCIIKHRGGFERGKFTLPVNGTLLFRKAEMQWPVKTAAQSPAPLPSVTESIMYTYNMPQASILVLNMPASYYKDSKRNLAVKLVCICYYRKKQ